MTVPLFDVKAKLSEYITMAENGEVIEITKYGKTSAVIVSLKEYEEHPMSRKDLLDEDSVKVLEQFESVCKKDLTDAEFRKEINDIVKSYTDKIQTEFFFGGLK